MLRKIIVVYSDNQLWLKNIPCGSNTGLLKVKEGGIYDHHFEM